MTYPSSGASLAQTQDVDQLPSSSASSLDSSSSSPSTVAHAHSHLNSHGHSRGRHHIHLHRSSEDKAVKAQAVNIAKDNSDSDALHHSQQHHSQSHDASTDSKLEIREIQTGYVTRVIQTISFVQVVDSTGAPIELQTLYGTPNTYVIDSGSGLTISASNPESSAAAPPGPASNSVPTENVAQSSVGMTPNQASASSVNTASVSAYALPPVDYSNPVATPAATTSLSAAFQDKAVTPSHNATSSIISTTSSQSLLTDITSTTAASSKKTTSEKDSTKTSESMHLKMVSSSTKSLTSSSATSVSSTATSLSTTDVSSTIFSETWTSTHYGDYQGGGGNFGAPTTDAAINPTSTATNSTNGPLSTQQKQVIGGVVGSIAGIAMLAVLVLLALKYKKRQSDRTLLGDDSAGTRTRALITGGNGSGGAMTERSGPFGVAAAALAGMSPKRSSKAPEPVGERGFYRVSGKKLPSVLRSGGDGYTDPRDTQSYHSNRESAASGHTDYWRGSQAFEPAGDGLTRLALGTPMRPVSGVPIIRTGPARTAVKEENPFADPVPRPRPDSDALGDSIAGGSVRSLDGSGNSPSRFRERI
ncbi:hypothetical protein BGZ63DRAFT_424229 [Mariannaea sp. PMI_226]|nr:hypothetical protein BGZ63DRAFT_424229 [Mariannaea sp. PMI_226]